MKTEPYKEEEYREISEKLSKNKFNDFIEVDAEN
jgi:hypothetical protein